MEDADLGALVARLQRNLLESPSREARLELVSRHLPTPWIRGWSDERTARAWAGSGPRHVELRVLAHEEETWERVALSIAVGAAVLHEVRTGSVALTVTLDEAHDWPATDADLLITLAPTDLGVEPGRHTAADEPALIALRRALGEPGDPGEPIAFTPHARFGPGHPDQAVAAVRALLAVPHELERAQG